MDLVGAIYHGRVGVTTHASSAHLVDAVAGNMIVIEVHNVPKAQGVKHLGGIGTDLPIHGFFVVFELTINIQDRLRSEERRVGKECRSAGGAAHAEKHIQTMQRDFAAKHHEVSA